MQNYDTLTQYIARQTMQLKDVNMCMSYVYTTWREKPTLIMFDNLDRKIISTFFDVPLQKGDLEVLTEMIDDFLNNT